MSTVHEQVYDLESVAWFKKSKEKYGGFSNMAMGFTLIVNGIAILTSETLFQLCKFPHLPEVQQMLIDQKSPMGVQMAARPFNKKQRSDWFDVNVSIMRWAVGVKLAQHWDTFGELLLSTGDKPIVENSSRDRWWGAVPEGQTMRGMNQLGIILMELREIMKSDQAESLRTIEPLALEDFKLLGQKILSVQT